MKAMIFAAGLGTRLRPFTDNMPKALFPVCGKPLIWHVIKKLSAAGVSEIVVNVHHFADKIEDYLASTDFGVRIVVSDERDRLLDTGGGILKARTLLSEGNFTAGRFLVHNVDILSDIDLCGFVSSSDPAALATLAVSSRKSSRYLLFDGNMRLVGWMNDNTGEVRSPYENLNVESCRRYAFSGIHLMSEKIFEVMDGWHKDNRFSIMDFYIDVAACQLIKGVVNDSMKIVDVGKIESLPFAESLLNEQRRATANKNLRSLS